MIELEVTAPWEPRRPAPWALARSAPWAFARSTARPSGRLRSQQTWWAGPLTVLLLALGALTGATPGQRLAPVFRLPVGVRQIVAGHDVLVAFVRAPEGGFSLRAYHLGDFALAWRSPVGGEFVWGAGGDMVVLRLDPDTDMSGLWILDAGTGREVWHRPRVSFLGSTDDLVIVSEIPVGGDRPVDPVETAGAVRQPIRTILALDRHSGAVRWSASTARGTQIELAGGSDLHGPSQLVEVATDGQTQVRDLVTGTVSSSTVIDVAIPPLSIVTHDDLVILDGDSGLQTGATAYGVGDGQLRWRHIDQPGGVLRPCGRWLCDFGESDTELLDPATGASRWRLAGWQAQFEGPHDRMVLAQAPLTERPVLAIVDLRTGKIRTRLNGWRMAGSVPSGASEGRVVVTNADRHGGGLIAIVDLDDGRLTVVGRADQRSGSLNDAMCVTAGRYVACRAGLETVVWPLPAGTVG
jgi:hypothetical protein